LGPASPGAIAPGWGGGGGGGKGRRGGPPRGRGRNVPPCTATQVPGTGAPPRQGRTRLAGTPSASRTYATQGPWNACAPTSRACWNVLYRRDVAERGSQVPRPAILSDREVEDAVSRTGTVEIGASVVHDAAAGAPPAITSRMPAWRSAIRAGGRVPSSSWLRPSRTTRPSG